MTSRAPAPGPIPGAVSVAQEGGQAIAQAGQALSRSVDFLYVKKQELDKQHNQVELAKFDGNLTAARIELLLQEQDHGAPERTCHAATYRLPLYRPAGLPSFALVGTDGQSFPLR